MPYNKQNAIKAQKTFRDPFFGIFNLYDLDLVLFVDKLLCCGDFNF